MDLATSERPDELILRGWSAGLDRKAVLREGTDAARYLLAGERDELSRLFWPVPRRLEAVSLWTENWHPVTGVPEELRPFASAVVPACIAGALLAHYVVLPRAPALGETMTITGVIVATYALLGAVQKVLIRASLRRQVARLDEDTALGIVLDALRRGMRRTAARIPRACERIREGLARCAPARVEASFTWPAFEVHQPLDGGRSWTAAFDSHDQHKDDVYYLVRLFQGDDPSDEFMVEIGTEWTGDDWTVPTFLPELQRRIAEVAATGKTNTAYRR